MAYDLLVLIYKVADVRKIQIDIFIFKTFLPSTISMKKQEHSISTNSPF